MMRPGSAANGILAERHYLGPARRGFAWIDDLGALVFAKPTSRRLPQDGSWLEVTRWCLYGTPNGGSRQWAKAWREVARMVPELTTFVSYSDPSAGHTGALYRACNWIWAPTWHRLRPPPSGNGSWTDGHRQAVKDRWVFPVRRDASRVDLLRINDAAVAAIHPGYIEPKRMPKP